MGTAFQETIVETFRVVSCYTCSLRFGITSELYKRAVTDAQGSIFCPACGNRTRWCESDDQKRIKELNEKLALSQQQLRNSQQQAMNEMSRRSAAEEAAKKAERKLKRVNAGVCPCCNRTFQNLAQHMSLKHPGQENKYAEVDIKKSQKEPK